MGSDLLNAVRSLYARDELWSETGKKLVSGIFKPKIRWELCFKSFMDEFRDVEVNYRSVAPTEEPIKTFVSRIIDRLALGRKIENDEVDILKRAISGESLAPELESENSKAIILRSFFEIGRIRPKLPELLNYTEVLLKHVITTDNLICWPLSSKLPRSTDEKWFRPEAITMAHRIECRNVPDYHIILAIE